MQHRQPTLAPTSRPGLTVQPNEPPPVPGPTETVADRPVDAQADTTARTAPVTGRDQSGLPEESGDSSHREMGSDAIGGRQAGGGVQAVAASGSAPASRRDASDNGTPETTCTAPQLRRFIKSRAYVPMHELRRRFGINGPEDDVTRIEVGGEQLYIGLPSHEGRLMGELVRGGEVGYELSFDPRSPVIVGVYPMRPVPRH